MVRRLWAAALLLGGAAHAAGISAQLDRDGAALGEPVTLTVEARGASLEALDLAPLAESFEVFSRTLSRGTDRETLVLTLYARAAGEQQIPPLALADLSTRALRLKVAEGSENVPRVSARWALEPAAPRVGQPVRLRLDICDDGSLQWRRPALPTFAGGIVRTLGEEQGEGEQAGAACTLQRFHWALLATRAGVASLELPMLDATRFGERLRFPGPTLAYEAAALPAWLPEHVPSLAPTVVVTPLPASWPLGRPLGWRFEVSGGYSADGLKALLGPQLRASAALGLYPPLVEAIEPDDPNSPLMRYAVTLYWQPRASGQVALPTLRLPWYDAGRGLLASSVVPGATLTVFDPRWQRARQAGGALLAALLLGAAGWQVSRMLRWRLARRRGIRAIRGAQDLAGLARAVRAFSLAGAPAAASLGEWKRRLQRETGRCDAAEAVSRFEQRAYGAAETGLGDLKQSFLQALAGARPKPLRRKGRRSSRA